MTPNPQNHPTRVAASPERAETESAANEPTSCCATTAAYTPCSGCGGPGGPGLCPDCQHWNEIGCHLEAIKQLQGNYE